MNDVTLMREALALAARARGHTSPNPMVGALIVRDGHIVGRGYHARAGQPHAEVVALREAGEAARGATLYVTLEPCCHHGRTPPCTDAIIAAGIRRVVAATADADPRVRGQGFAALRAAGIEVQVGLCQDEARQLNEAFFTHRLLGRPFVLYKAAASLDGKVATPTGASRWISSPASRARVHQLRAELDAILVGVGTVLADDPRLTARPGERPPALAQPEPPPLPERPPDPETRQPWRVIADSRAQTPPTARALRPGPPGPTLIAVTEAAPAERVDALRQAGAEVWVGPAGPDGRLDPSALLQYLGQRGIISLLLEGGPTLAASLLSAGLIDRVLFFLAPLLIGGPAPGLLGGPGFPTLAGAPRLTRLTAEPVGPDLAISAYIGEPAWARLPFEPS